MTVCIAALCADASGQSNKAAVVASDRMVTLGGFIEFEHEVPKSGQVSGKILALIAGDALRGSRMVRELASVFLLNPTPVQTVAQAAASTYLGHRQQQIDAEVFAPRGVSMKAFYEGLQQQWVPGLPGIIDGQVINYNYGVDVVIAGVDDAGSHLYSVHNPGQMADYAPIGFQAIGSGAIHALQSMIGFGHTGARGLNNTLFSVYASKRRAEVAPGVGKDTDMAIILDSGIQFLPTSALDQLATFYEEYHRPIDEELVTKIGKFDLHGKESGNGSK